MKKVITFLIAAVMLCTVISIPTFAAESDGWTYADSLPATVTSANYTIQYRPVYTTKAATAPDTTWVKGSVSHTAYQNKGSVYESPFELETSSTRKLVDYYYYHFCSGNKGIEVNYAQTNTFVHYDGLSSNVKVTCDYSCKDYADSRYTFYRLKYADSGNYVYCSSGVTCDGSYGSHGNRSYYWYKKYLYQDLEAVTYYNYSKVGQWSSTLDKTATSYTVRYKLNNVTLGTTSKISATATDVSAKLAWTAVPNATGYRVYKYESGSWKTVANTTKNSYTVSKLKPGTKNIFAVKAFAKVSDKVVWAKKYATATVNTLPSVPSKIAATPSATAVKLNWTKATGAKGYRVYKYDTATKKWTVAVASTTAITATVKGLAKGSACLLAVRSFTKIGTTIVWSPYLKISTATQPTTVTKIAQSAQTTNQITLKWTKSQGATGYRVYLYNATTKKWTTAVSATTAVTATIKKLSPGTVYLFAVRPYTKTSSGVVWGEMKNFKAATIPSLPTTISAGKTANGKTPVTWGKCAGATGYRLYKQNSTTGKLTVVTTTTKNTTTLTTPAIGSYEIYAIRPYIKVGSTVIWSDKWALFKLEARYI